MIASRSNVAPVVLANRRENNGFRRHGGSLTAMLLGSAVLLSPMAAHAQALNLGGSNQTVSSRTGAGNVTNTGGGSPATLTFDVTSGGPFTMTGGILETDIANQISVIKNGADRQNLNGASTYTGGTIVNDGILGFGTNTSFGTGTITLNGGQIAATGITLTLANNINVIADSRILSNNTILSGTISGSARILKFTSSIMNITGVNTGFTGGFLVGSGSGGGTINVGEATLGAGAIDTLGGSLATFETTSAARISLFTGTHSAVLSNNFVLGGGTFSVQPLGANDIITLNGTISGSQSLWLNASLGELVLNGNNSGFTGATISDGGTLTAGNNNAFGTGATAIVRINHDTTLKAGAANLVIANRFNVGATGNDILTVDTNGNDMTLSGPINNGSAANKGSLVKVGAGKLTLTSTTSTYSIGTSINGGTLSVSSSPNLGITAPLDFDGGTLQITGTSFTSTSRPITLNAGGGGFDIDSAANTLNLSNVIVGTGGLTKLGAGTLTLNAANTFTGNSAVNAGTLNLANSQGFGTGGTVTLAGGELKAGNPGLDLTRDVILSGGGIDTNGEDFTLSGMVSGASNLTMHGFGTLILTNSGNTYSGDTVVNDGAVQANASDVFGTGAILLSDGTKLIAGATLSFNNDVSIAPTSIIDTGTNDLTLNGAVHDNGLVAGAINKDGSGTLILTQASDFTGGTNINAGAINIDDNDALGTGAVVMAGGTHLGGVNGLTIYTLPNDITINGLSTIGDNVFVFEVAGNIDGPGKLVKGNGQILTLFGNNSYTGGTEVGTGELYVGQNNSLGGVAGGDLTLGDGTALHGYNPGVVLPNAIFISGTSADALTDNLTLAGNITGGILNVINAGGYLQLTGTNTHASTSIGAGALLIAGADANLGVGALEFAGPGATLQFANATTFTRDMTMTANGNIDTNGFSGGISGAITGAGLVNKVGTGTLTLSNVSNSFLALAISGGEVDVTSEAATGGGTIIMHSGTLGLQGVSSLSNDIQVSGFGPTNTIDGGGAASVALNGVISDIAPATFPRNLVLTNATEFDIAGANTYTGTLTISGTELVVGDANSIGANSATLVLDGGTLSSSASVTLAQNIGIVPATYNYVGGANDIVLNGDIDDPVGNAALEVYGSGIVTLASTSGFSRVGTLFVSGTANLTGDLTTIDTVVLGGGTIAGTGTITNILGSNDVLNGGIINPGDATVANSIGTLTVGNLNLSSGALLNWDFAAPGTNDQVAINGTLILDGTLNINNLSGFGLGTYTLFTYTPGLGNLTDNGLIVTPIGSLPGVFFGVDVSVAGIVKLQVTGNITQYWDGPHLDSTSVEGGSGTWNAVLTNWTDASGTTNGVWNGIDAVFTAAQGTVTVSGTQNFTSLYFKLTDGYILTGGTLNGAASSLIKADSGITTTIDSVISGIGTALDIDYAGSTLNLGGNNSFTGDVHLNGGTLGIGNDNALGVGGALTMATGTTLVANAAGLTISNDIDLGGAATIDAGGYSTSYTGVISGSGPLTLDDTGGSGDITLAVGNTYTGGTALQNGVTVIIGGNTALGAAAGALAIDSSTLQTTATFTSGRAITLTSFANFAPDVSTTLTLTGLIGGTGNLNQTGAGTLVLGNAGNSFTGDVHISGGGVLSIASDANLGNAANKVYVTSGTLAYSGSTSSARDVDLGAGSTIDTAGNTISLTGLITGGGLTKAGSGRLTLNGDMSGYVGTTTINDGTLAIGAGNGATIGDALVFAGAGNGTLDLTAAGFSLSSAPITMTAAGQIVIGAQHIGLIGDITGTGKLTYDGTNPTSGVPGSGGRLELNGDNSGFSGGIVIKHGELYLGNSNASGTGSIETQGSIITYANGITVISPLVVNSATTQLNVAGTDLATQSGNISELGGSRPLDKIGTGQLDLTGSSTLSGIFSVRAGTIGVGNDAAFGDASGTNFLDIKNGAAIVAINGPRAIGQTIRVSSNATIDAGGQQFTLNGTIGDNPGPNAQPLKLTDSGVGGRLILASGSSYTGGTKITNAIVQIGADSALGAFSAVAMDNSTLETSGTISTLRQFTLTNANIFDTMGNNLFLAGAVDGTGSLRKEGAGLLALSATNSYAGGTFIGDGSVRVGADANLGASGTSVTFDNTGNGQLITTAGFVTTRNIILTANGAIDNTGTLQLDGVVSGSGDLSKNGTGELYLNNINTNSGAVHIIQGAVRLGTNAAFGDAGATNIVTMENNTTLIAGAAPVVGGFPRLVGNDMVLNGAVTVDLLGTSLSMNPILSTFSSNGAALGLFGDISGTGSLTNVNSGALILLGNNSYSGGTTFSNGILGAGTSSAFGTGTVSLGFNSWLIGQPGAPLTLANDIDLTSTLISIGGGTLGVGPDLTLSGAISGANGFDKVGTEVLTLTGTNTYSGTTNVGAGTLLVNGANNGAGAVTVANGATLGGSGSITGAVSIANGGTLAPGNSPGTLTVGSLSLLGSSVLNWELGDPNISGGANNDLVIVTNNLTLDGLLTVTDPGTGAGFGLGVYQLMTYGGVLTNNGLTVAALPPTFNGFVQTSISGQVNLVITAPGVMVQDWQGADLVGNGTNDGGTGTWNAANTNWSASPWGLNTNWQSGVAVFGGATGTVTVVGTQNFQGLQFGTAGYTLTGGTLNNTVSGGFISDNVAGTQIDSDITGAALAKQGTSVTGLGGNNSFASLDIQAGGVLISTNTALGAGTVTMATGTSIEAASGVTAANNIVLNGSTVFDDHSNTLTLNGVISGAGSTDLNKNGTGTLVLNGANTYAGVTNLNAGTLNVGSATALSSGALNMATGTTLQAGGTLTIANAVDLTGSTTVDTNGNDLTLSGIIGGASATDLNKIGVGILTLTGANTFAGVTNLNVGTINVGNAAALSGGALNMATGTTLQAGGTFTVANAVDLTGSTTIDTNGNDLTLSGALGGTGGFDKAGAGTLTLTGTNSYAGATNVTTGTLLVNGTNNGTGLTSVTTGAALGGSGTLVGAVDVGAGATLFAGQLTGATVGVLTVGDLTLNATSNLNFEFGAPNVSGLPDNDLIIVNGNITLDGLLNVTDPGTGPGFGLGVYQLFTYTGGITDNGLTVSSLPGGFTGVVQATLIPGQVNLLVANPGTMIQHWQGTDTVGNGTDDGGNGTWNAGNSNWSSSPYGLNTNWQSGIAVFAGATGTVTVSGTQNFQGLEFTTNNYVLNSGTLNATTAGFIAVGVTDATINSDITGAALAKQLTGNLNLGGNNSFASLDIQDGMVTAFTNTALGAGPVTMASGTTLRAGATVALANDVAFNGASTVDTQTFGLTLNGVLTGSGAVTKNGSGTLFLTNNSNSYSGGTTVTGGTVNVTVNNALGTGNVALNAGTTLQAGATVVLANDVALVGNSTLDTQANNMTLNGIVSGGGQMTKIGSGMLTLNNANTYSGGTLLNVGTINVGNDSALGTASLTMAGATTLQAGTTVALANNVILNGSSTIDTQAFGMTLGGVVSGTGPMNKIGTGTLTLNNSNTYTGPTNLNFGTINVGTNTALGTGQLNMAGGTILQAGVSGLVMTNTIATLAGGRIDQGSGTFQLNGVISGVGSISTIGTGNLILGGNNTFSGGLGINVSGSTVTLLTNTAAGAAGIALNDGATLAAGVSGLVVA
ncbi:beta strand repeat-containing protein, partial [Polymorphobacter arshaanensis]